MGNRQKIGWIGLGKMGTPMSINLLKAGYELCVHDIVESNVKRLTAQGAERADSLESLASQVDVIISMIPDDRVLEAISIDAEGILNFARPGTIYIDMSTVSPGVSADVSQKAEDRDIKYLRAPVSGSTALAESAKLTIFVSGPKDAYDCCESIFLKMGQKSFYVGDGEQARYLKLVVNAMVGLTAAMVAEALSFGEKGGMDWQQMIDIVNNSVVASPLINYKAEALKKRDFTPAFTAAQMAKDFGIVLNTGQNLGLPMPLVKLVQEHLEAMKSKDRGELDFFGLITLWEEMGNRSKKHERI